MMNNMRIPFGSIGSVCVIVFLLSLRLHSAPATSVIQDIEWQPVSAQIERLIEAMGYLGSPLPPAVTSAFAKIQKQEDLKTAPEELQKLLDPLCLVVVEINPESRV